jgi:hypothetical protein
MRSRYKFALLILTLAVPGCGGPPTDIRHSIATFQEHANAGRLAEIRRDHTPAQTDFERYMAGRAALGRMLKTTEAKAETVRGYFTVTLVHHNTEFERGHAMEVFSFRSDDAGTRLDSYSYHVGKRVWCPAIVLFSSQCSIEEARVRVTSAG